MQIWSHGVANAAGVGAYAYQDSAGNRDAVVGPIFGSRTRRRFGAIPNFGFGQGFGMPGFENRFGGPALGPNSAFAGGAVAPGYRHQMVSINPANPKMPNIDVTQFSDTPRSGNGFYSVSSTSYSSSSNLNGKEENSRGGETVVNDNGKVTKYKLNN